MPKVGDLRFLAARIVAVGLSASAALVTASGGVLAQVPPATAPQTAAQEPGPTFRGGVDLIQLVVSVLDDKREPVRGLTAADFTILDDGTERPIRVFTPVDVPGAERSAGVAAWTREVAPDIATNQVEEQPGRLVVILMDRSIHQGPTAAAWQVARSIVDALGPNDLAALVATNELGRSQNFTTDRTRLTQAIDQRAWAIGSNSAPWTLEEALADIRCLCGLCVMETVTRIAEAIRDTPGRAKSLFFIGSGMVLQTHTAPCDHKMRVARQAMLDAIDLSNLTVHSIDPKGLESIGPQTRASVSGDNRGLPEGEAARLRREAHHAETTGTLAAQGTLHVLPDLTGGRTVVNRNLPEELVPAIFRESESYYVLGFEAATEGRSGAPRSIEVKVARSGVDVSTRRRYVPPTAIPPNSTASATTTAPGSSDESVSGLLPHGATRLTMALTASAGPDGSDGIVSVSIDASGFVYDTESSIPLAVSVTAVDQTGRPVASVRQTSTIPGPRPTRIGVPAIHIPTHLALPPGDYEVRAAIRDTASGTAASVFSHVVVPAFASERLSLSDIAVERVAGSSGAATPFPAIVPSTERSFIRSARVQALLQVYQGTERRNPLVPVSVTTRLIDTQNRVVSERTEILGPDAFRNRRADFKTVLPMAQLPAGDYLLSVVAQAGDRTANRTMRFRIQ